ncbi:MAG: class I SAM-dependent methyltransferase [Prochloraceae cyanobacterium]|nr:class I SAM-dependent methyltransferase [Prochloraceae cyanobacterium]
MESNCEPLLEPILRWMRLKQVISNIPQNSIILDIGCGTSATFLKTISPKIKQGFGVDFKVENATYSNIKTIQLRLDGRLPFPEDSFDVVTMLAVLEHIENEEKILKEIERILVSGGKLIITVPSTKAQPILEFLAYKLKIISEAEIKDHKRYYNRSKLKKLLIEKSGFEEFSHQYFQLWMNNFCTVVKRSV